mgnify:FL=1
MKGKHLKEEESQPKKQAKKRKRKLKIVDKPKFIRAITFCILFLILIGVIIFKVVSGSNAEPITNEMIDNMMESVETTNNITTSNDVEITSRGSIVPRTELKTPTVLETPETLYVNVKKGVNVRDTYSTEGNKVKALVYGSQVTVTEKMDNWGKIGDNQWVLLDNLSTTKPVIEEPKKENTTTNTRNNKTNNVSTNENTGNWIKFTATGYCSCAKCCGKTTGTTASGTKATAGRTVAMSSKYAFGTKVEIKGMGTYTVEDRGGAINGNKIDIYFASHQEALNFGRRTVYLRVV